MTTNKVILIVVAVVFALASVVGAVMFMLAASTDQSAASNVTAIDLFDEGEEESFEIEQQLDVILFFQGGGTSLRLIPAKRQIFNMISISQQAKQVLQLLINGPERGEGYSTIPRSSKLLRLYISKQGIAYVVFDNTISSRHPKGTRSELMTVYSIVSTLTVNFPTIQAVKIVVEGRNDNTLAGHIDIAKPLYPEEDYFANAFSPPIAKEQTSDPETNPESMEESEEEIQEDSEIER